MIPGEVGRSGTESGRKKAIEISDASFSGNTFCSQSKIRVHQLLSMYLRDCL